jgi:uncharacterized membrane protein YfhO
VWILSDRDAEEAGGAAEISNYRETTNAAFFDAAVDEAGAWIVLSLVQDGGWSARDGHGRVLPLARANGPFLALHLPRGSHRVALAYSPPGFVPGSWISAGTLVLLLAAAVRRRRAESRA